MPWCTILVSWARTPMHENRGGATLILAQESALRAGWFPQQQLQTLLGVAVGVTSNCALCQVYHRGNLRDVNVIYVKVWTGMTRCGTGMSSMG